MRYLAPRWMRLRMHRAHARGGQRQDRPGGILTTFAEHITLCLEVGRVRRRVLGRAVREADRRGADRAGGPALARPGRAPRAVVRNGATDAARGPDEAAGAADVALSGCGPAVGGAHGQRAPKAAPCDGGILPPITPRFTDTSRPAPAIGEKRGTVAFFYGCIQEAFLAGINAATIRVLQRNGYARHFPESQMCCGAAQGTPAKRWRRTCPAEHRCLCSL